MSNVKPPCLFNLLTVRALRMNRARWANCELNYVKLPDARADRGPGIEDNRKKGIGLYVSLLVSAYKQEEARDTKCFTLNFGACLCCSVPGLNSWMEISWTKQ